jgi:hypothetical protein
MREVCAGYEPTETDRLPIPLASPYMMGSVDQGAGVLEIVA